MSLASELGEHFIFLVVGPVDKAFVGKKIPDNVVFTGRVPNLQEQLSSCDAFINPKEGLDTGAEMKMYDYLGYGKPIFASEEGARGFEGRPEIIICQIKEMAGKIVNLRVNTEKAD
jgi:glycosyltransferase involved in cell wall biosynthesis